MLERKQMGILVRGLLPFIRIMAHLLWGLQFPVQRIRHSRSCILTDNLIILPSSLHELIVLPENQYTGDCEACAEMVKNVNTSVVLPEDYLSDHVYTYNRDTQELEIAA